MIDFTAYSCVYCKDTNLPGCYCEPRTLVLKTPDTIKESTTNRVDPHSNSHMIYHPFSGVAVDLYSLDGLLIAEYYRLKAIVDDADISGDDA